MTAAKRATGGPNACSVDPLSAQGTLLSTELEVSGVDDRRQARFSFGEHLSRQNVSSWEDFEEWDPYVSKVHCHHFGGCLLPRDEVQGRFPGIRFVLLERRDSCAQAASLALANRTGVTQCTTERQLTEFRGLEAELSDTELLDCHRAVLDYLEFWRNWLHSERRLVVTYESLIEQPRETVAEILDFLKTPHGEIALGVPLRKLAHPRSGEFTDRLRRLVGGPETTCGENDERAADETPKHNFSVVNAAETPVHHE